MKPVKIYAQEIADGIAEIIKDNNSIACISLAKESLITEDRKPIQVSVASANPNQLDLFYLDAILASTGWNDNHDIFLPDEMWAARATPEDKQFNYMHYERDIIGHITGNYILDFENNLLPNDIEMPEEFSIGTHNVLYTSWTDPELSARMNKIIAEVKDGQWFVSMECLFPSFDYELKSQAGDRKLITRSEATAYLSKYLRAYGGDGVYQGYTIGRVLRNFTFSGMGLVNRPANKKSLITKVMDDKPENKEEEKSLSGEINMSVDLTKELEDTKAQLAEALATIATLNGFKGQAETLEGSVADLQLQIKTLNDQLSVAKADLAEAMKQKDQSMQEMDKMKKEQKMSKRKASLTDAGLEDSEVEETLASTDSLEDEAFDKIVAMMKKKGLKMPKEKTEAKEAETITVVVEPEKTVASVNTIVETPKPVNLREEMGKWIGSNCLKTLK